jgi:tripartite-type tricarboxylate transporter receptor subunit TctC
MQPSRLIGALAVALLLPAAPCAAQAPADFYRGKTIELDIGLGVGGAYDAYARRLILSDAKA